MNQPQESVDRYVQQFRSFESLLNGETQSPVHALRRRALERFRTLGFPTQRHEDWRYTNLHPLVDTVFQTPGEGRPTGDVFALHTLPFIAANDAKCVFVNGRFDARLSTASVGAVLIGSLAEAIAEQPGLVLPHLESLRSDARDSFAELNAAFLRDGAFLHVPDNTVLSQPVHLVFVSTAERAPLVTHPRILIVAGQGSQIGVTETHLSDEGVVCLTNALAEIIVGENAVVDHYRMQQESRSAFHISNVQVLQKRASVYRNHSFLFGASLMRNTIAAALDGEGAETVLHGLYLLGGAQHSDTHSIIEHAQPNCSSRERYKGIMDQHARGVFCGRIIVRADAQHTDAQQSNNNLLLSDTASVDTKPQLEILANDVRCTHGATVGRLDEEALFYLRSRGIGTAEARDLLIAAFAGDIVSQVRIDALRDYLDRSIHVLLQSPTL